MGPYIRCAIRMVYLDVIYSRIVYIYGFVLFLFLVVLSYIYLDLSYFILFSCSCVYPFTVLIIHIVKNLTVKKHWQESCSSLATRGGRPRADLAGTWPSSCAEAHPAEVAWRHGVQSY